MNLVSLQKITNCSNFPPFTCRAFRAYVTARVQVSRCGEGKFKRKYCKKKATKTYFTCLVMIS